jgi:hypothetical protein
MSSGHQPSWERLLAWLVVAAISINILASELPRLMPALVILAAAVGVLRLIWWYTRL